MTLEEVSEALQAIPALVEAVERLAIEVRSLKEIPSAHGQQPQDQRSRTGRRGHSSKSSRESADEKYVSRQELAARLGCHLMTIKRAEKRGELHSIRLNSRFLRYRESEVARWIADASSDG